MCQHTDDQGKKVCKGKGKCCKAFKNKAAPAEAPKPEAVDACKPAGGGCAPKKDGKGCGCG